MGEKIRLNEGGIPAYRGRDSGSMREGFRPLSTGVVAGISPYYLIIVITGKSRGF